MWPPLPPWTPTVGPFAPARWWHTRPFMTITPQLLHWAAVGCRGRATCGDPWVARAARTQEPFLFGLSGLFLELSWSFTGHDCPPILSRPL